MTTEPREWKTLTTGFDLAGRDLPRPGDHPELLLEVRAGIAAGEVLRPATGADPVLIEELGIRGERADRVDVVRKVGLALAAKHPAPKVIGAEHRQTCLDPPSVGGIPTIGRTSPVDPSASALAEGALKEPVCVDERQPDVRHRIILKKRPRSVVSTVSRALAAGSARARGA